MEIKHDSDHMFPLADTLRLSVFSLLRFRRNRTTFFYVSVKFPSKETGVSASVNAWHPRGNTRKRSGIETSQFYVSVNVIGSNYCGNTSLRDGNRCFQVISIVKKRFSPSWGGFLDIYNNKNPFSRHFYCTK